MFVLCVNFHKIYSQCNLATNSKCICLIFFCHLIYTLCFLSTNKQILLSLTNNCWKIKNCNLNCWEHFVTLTFKNKFNFWFFFIKLNPNLEDNIIYILLKSLYRMVAKGFPIFFFFVLIVKSILWMVYHFYRTFKYNKITIKTYMRVEN